MSPSQSGTWTCDVCSRQVPGRIDTCYCGRKRPKESSRASRPAAPGGGPSPMVKLGIAGTAAVALLAAGVWYSSTGQPAVTTAPPPVQSQARPPSAGRSSITLEPASRGAATENPDASAPPLEDTIERAMPAIVMVEAPGSRGSGFFAAPDLIVTNAHVLAGSRTATITTRNGSHLEGRAVIVSEQRDLALLQIPPQNAMAVALPLGRSSGVRLGQGVVALGWAEGLTQSTVTRGVVTGLRQAGERLLLQTDAVPNPGDSGGPLLDLRGNVIGITSARLDTGTAGFALAIDEAKPFFERVPPNTAGAPGAAQVAAPPPPASSGPSASDARRTIGLQHYDDALASIEMAAAQLDANWGDYKKGCHITSVPGGQSHEWFALYDPRSPLHSTAPNCADYLAQIEQRARAVSASMAAAAEIGRQSGLYAGELRTLQAKHHLDYAGWDR